MTSFSDSGVPLPAGTDTGQLDLPDRALFWRWVWASVRPIVGWLLAALGGLALFLGWWGVSGQALTAKQLPYLVSGGLTGVALVLLAAVFLVSEDLRRQLGRLDRVERQVAELHALLVAEMPESTPVQAVRGAGTDLRAPAQRGGTEELVALPHGTTYHRAACALVAGKPAVQPISAAEAAGRGLRACRLCEPPTPLG